MDVVSGDPKVMCRLERVGLVYVWTDGRVGTSVDVAAVPDKRERAVCKALLQHAMDLIEEAETAEYRKAASR